jgi:hypothetical protein
MAPLEPRTVENGLESDVVVSNIVASKVAITCRCIGKWRFWTAKQAWRFAAERWIAG